MEKIHGISVECFSYKTKRKNSDWLENIDLFMILIICTAILKIESKATLRELFSVSFQMKTNIILRTDYFESNGSRLVHNQVENCHYDLISFNLKGI